MYPQCHLSNQLHQIQLFQCGFSVPLSHRCNFAGYICQLQVG